MLIEDCVTKKNCFPFCGSGTQVNDCIRSFWEMIFSEILLI